MKQHIAVFTLGLSLLTSCMTDSAYRKVENGLVADIRSGQAKAVKLEVISDEVTNVTKEVANTISDVAQGSTTQAEELMAMSGTLGTFGDTLDSTTQLVKVVDSHTKEIQSKANSSGSDLANIVNSLDTITKTLKDISDKTSVLTASVAQVTEITDVIDSIAGQTNLLALNASIESA